VVCCALMMGLWRRGLLPFGPPGHSALPRRHPMSQAHRLRPKMDAAEDQTMDPTQESVAEIDPVEALQQEFVDGKITVEAYERELDRIFRREGDDGATRRD
jgi:hypothetical protein